MSCVRKLDKRMDFAYDGREQKGGIHTVDITFWIVIAIAMAAVEFGTVALVSAWFVVGAVVALIAALLGVPFWLQAVIFVLVSGLLLLLFRPFLRKVLQPNKLKTNVDALAGKRALVTQTVDNLRATGTVKLDGVIWAARSANDTPIAEGTVVTVQRVEGVKLMVVPEKVPAAMYKN